mgnify:CR=1 FL=1
MNWYRKYPLFASGLTLCGLVAVGELALIYERYSASREAAKRLEQRRVELEGMAQLTPPPTREVAASIEADLAKAQKSLAAMQSELTGRGPAAERMREAKVPAARTDSYFDIATFVERMREMADKNGVEVRPEAARFGFSHYVNEGPETERIEPVFRQRLVAEYVLGALLEARPRSLIGVKRVRTLTKAEKEARAAALANGLPPEESTGESESESADYFAVGPGVTAKVPGYVEAMGFRVTFVSQTASLRNFLNRLSAFELPILVREVEVDAASAEETLAASGTETAATPAIEAPASVVLAAESGPATVSKGKPTADRAGRASIPIVPKSYSRFTVTLEYIELLPAPGSEAGSAESAPQT